MPKSTPATAAATRDSTELQPLEIARQHADAMVRAALECCRQHDRLRKLIEKPAHESEEQAVSEMCHACDSTLDKAVGRFGDSLALVEPQPRGEEWSLANAVWIAAREYTRRHAGCDQLLRTIRKHSADQLGSMHLEWELEASALLALRQACDGYMKLRPDALA